MAGLEAGDGSLAPVGGGGGRCGGGLLRALPDPGDHPARAGSEATREGHAMRSGLWYTAIVAMVAVTVGALGSIRLAGEARQALWVGAAVGFAVQTAGFWLLFVWAFP